MPRLADQGEYLASESTFYRILHTAEEQRHRGRSRAPRPPTPPPRHCARGPREVWSWDITWLPGPVKGLFFYLYLIIIVFTQVTKLNMLAAGTRWNHIADFDIAIADHNPIN